MFASKTLVYVALAVMAPALLGGCGSSAPKVNASTLLQKCKATVDSSSSVHFKLTSKDVSTAQTNLVGGEGDLARPDSLQGSFAVALSGFTANVQVASVDGVFEAKLPFHSGYQKANPSDLGLTDPAQLFNPHTGLTRLLTLAQNPRSGPTVRTNGELLDTVSYTVPGSKVPVLPDANPAQQVRLTLAINPSSYQLRTVTLVGPFTTQKYDSTYVLSLTNYNEHVTITLPPAS